MILKLLYSTQSLGSTGSPIEPAHPSWIHTNASCGRGRSCMRIHGWTFFLFHFQFSSIRFDSSETGPNLVQFCLKWAETGPKSVNFFFLKPWNALEEEENKIKRKIRTRLEQKLETHLKSEATAFPRYRGSRATKKRKRKIRIEIMTDWVCEKEWMWLSGSCG